MGHYYDHLGNPCHTYINDKGVRCDTDVRRARKENWLPSHSEIEKSVTDSTGLEIWKLGQHLEWCYNNCPEEGETWDQYFERAKHGGDTVGREARDFGIEVHDAFEQYAKHGLSPENNIVMPFIHDHIQWFSDNIQESIDTEVTVSSISLGVGGTIDLVAMHKELGTIVLDYKTQRVAVSPSGKKTPKFYPSWIRQMSLYSELYKRKHWLPALPRCVSLVIDSTEPGPVYVRYWTVDEQAWGFESEKANIVAWQKQKKYRPEGCNLEVIELS